jgi:Ca2+-binding RTX toxin-like protein
MLRADGDETSGRPTDHMAAEGGRGDGALRRGPGDDYLDGGGESDSLDGGPGFDTVSAREDQLRGVSASAAGSANWMFPHVGGEPECPPNRVNSNLLLARRPLVGG